MALDPLALTVALFATLTVLALAVPLVGDARDDAGLRAGAGSLAVMALAWGVTGLGLARDASPPAWSWALADALSVAACVLALRGVQAWMGPRHGWPWPWAWALPALVLLGQALAPGWRAGWGPLLLAAAQGWWLLALWRPAPEEPAHGRWAKALALPLGLLAALSLVRGFMGLDPSVDPPTLARAHPLALADLALTGATALVWALAGMAAWRVEAERALRAAAQTDALTGLANRRTLASRGAELIAHARRHGDTLVALSIDLDHFKQINDRHGPVLGDACLVLVADCLRALARPGDCVARVGGEEFVVLLGRTRPDGAQAFDRRLREALQAQAPERLGFFLNFSAGWSLLRPGDRHVHDLLQRADAGLYRAKGEGRGRLAAEPGLDAEDEA